MKTGKKIQNVSIPTENHRHTTKIRMGSFSHEAWAKKNIAKIPVDPDCKQ